ncbi:DUF4124 domain-containing protein [Roseateles sp. DC23W]|uniref:DUF4124 domain-containing protein n=1 Tax=Pelomonas dachongensis TaxID=3299029 RepID=A0ABW7ENA9_9BURK
MKLQNLSCLFVALAGLSGSVFSQHLPAPSRTVFKCEKDGRVHYSDEPCAAAKRLQVEPTRGMTSTGNERPGADVRREQFDEQMGDALRPLTGKDHPQFEVARKRVYLRPAVQRECAALDFSLPQAEASERVARDGELAEVQATLLKQRRRFRELKC